MKKEFMVEKVTQGKQAQHYKVIWRGDNVEGGVSFIKNYTGKERIELWSYHWVTTHLGYAPIAWKN